MFRVSISFVLLLFMFAAKAASTNTLTIVTGFDRPPYSIQDGKLGFEVELITQVFSNLSYKAQFITAPYGRTTKMLSLPNIDAVTTASMNYYASSEYLSAPYITYQNVAVSLKSSKISINGLQDLSKHSIATFQNASTILGEDFSNAAKKGKKYIEVSNQIDQMRFLRKQQVEVLVLDINIFHYFNQEFDLEVDIHTIFPPTKYGLLIKDSDLRAAFNVSFSELRHSEAYKKLLDKWNIKTPQEKAKIQLNDL